MNRKERLINVMSGRSVDRPPVCFYEIDGLTQDVNNPDEFNIYNDPSWKPLIELAGAYSDRLVMLPALTRHNNVNVELIPPDLVRTSMRQEGKRRVYQTEIQAGSRTLRQIREREADVDTLWCTEHLIKNEDDLEAWIALPAMPHVGEAFTADILHREEELGDTGCVMIDMGDPLCLVAGMMSMEDFTVIAMTAPELFRRALEKAAEFLLWNTQMVAQALPGRIWRICGPEYATAPYLPPELFHDYVTIFDREIIQAIKATGGLPRIHCHGNIRAVLDEIVATGCVALDPIEPPPQGDVELSYVKERYGDQLTLFGNLEAADIENLGEDAFRSKVLRALKEGSSGNGRGFVLMPSACPYGRHLTPQALRNYEVMVEEVLQISFR